MNKPRIIIEINDHWLKISALMPFLTGGRRLKAVARPLGSVEPVQVAALITETLKQEKIKEAPVVLCISRSQAMFWNLTLPSDDEKELRQMIELNVARIVPDKREQVIYNYAIAGKNERGFSQVTLAIIQRDFITKQISCVESAGLQVDDILLSSFGVFSMVAHRYRHEINPAEINLILDVDADFVDLLIVSANALLSSRSINIGAQQLGEEPNIKKLMGEVRQAVVVFHSQESGQKPARMFICGARANSDLIAASARQELGIDVKLAFLPLEGQNLPDSVSLTAPVEFVSNANSSQGIDFAVPEIQIRKSLRQKTREIMIAGALVFYLCFVLAGIAGSRQYVYQGYEAQLAKQLAHNSRMLGDTAEQYRQQEFIKARLDERRLPLIFLGYLLKSLPSEIAVKYVNLNQERKVILKGEAQELSDIYKFVSLLEKTAFCKDVKSRSTRKRKVKDRELTDFELNFSLEM